MRVKRAISGNTATILLLVLAVAIAGVAWVIFSSTVTPPAPVDEPPGPEGRSELIDDDDLVQRYPVGKSWRGLALLRVSGSGTLKRWMLEQEKHFTRTDRYAFRTEVLENGIGEARLRIDVLSAGTDFLANDERLRLRPLSDATPQLRFLLKVLDKARYLKKEVLTATEVIKRVDQVWRKQDPDYEKTLTQLRKLGLRIASQLPDTPAGGIGREVISDPANLEGCAFEIGYKSGWGVTGAPEQVAGPPLPAEELRKWAQGVKPLLDYYIFPNLDAQPGAQWSVNAAELSPWFALRGESRATGEAVLRYEGETELDGRKLRELVVAGSQIRIRAKGPNNDATYDADATSARVLFDPTDLLVRRASGPLKIGLRSVSTDHWFAADELSSDLKVEFLYEAERTDTKSE